MAKQARLGRWVGKGIMRPGTLEWCEGELKPRQFNYYEPDFRYRCATCGRPYVDDATFEENVRIREQRKSSDTE